MVLKCGGCSEYNNGDGTRKCLTCEDIKFVTERQRTVKPEYHDPHIVNHLCDNNIPDVWARLKCLNEREATMLIQHTLLEMTQADIAAYHNIDQATVSRTIVIAITKANSV